MIDLVFVCLIQFWFQYLDNFLIWKQKNITYPYSLIKIFWYWNQNWSKHTNTKSIMGHAEINAPGSYSVSVDADWKEMAVIYGFVSNT